MNNLLVTGGCGFIGSNFIRYVLDETDFRGVIVNLDAFTYAAHPGNLEDVVQRYGARYQLVHGDIRDQATVERVMDEYEIDTIVHFAAESHVDRSIVQPDDFIQTNIVGTYNLLEAARARRHRIERFHQISTDEVFGELGPTGYFREDSPYRPNSPYAASKAAADHLVRAYRRTYGLPISITHCSNNYGPYQFPEKLIPLMILNALEGRPLPVYGDGQQVRDWLFVRDHCRAIWMVLCSGREGETYGIGGRYEKTNLEVVRRICDLVDQLAPPLSDGRPRSALITHVADRPGHDRRYAMDCSKIETELGWRPEESFESGLHKTVRWYLEHRAWVESIRTGAYRQGWGSTPRG